MAQVNARNATADHDRQGQAAHRQYKLRIVVGLLVKAMRNRHLIYKYQRFSS